MAALRPAWGNPKGLNPKSIGDNMFIVEFGSKVDLDRVLDGSPWTVGNKVALIQKFDPSLRPTDISFDLMPVWVRIYNLPFGLMNKDWGMLLAGKIGNAEKVEVDAQNRAWGPYLRARVKIEVWKPLRRCVSIFSNKRQKQEWYDVRYERLPNYCYSCGIIGHSSLECPTPADRDENGLLPYGKDLCAPDDNRKKKWAEEKQSESIGRSFNSAERHGSFNGCTPPESNDSRGKVGVSTTEGGSHNVGKDDEAISPLKQQRKSRKKTEGEKMSKSGKELFPTGNMTHGKKRKQTKNPCSSSENNNELRKDSCSQDVMALAVANVTSQPLHQPDEEVVLEEHEEEKKIRKEAPAISAVAGNQLRREP